MASTPTATDRVLVALLDGPLGCGEVGEAIWGDSRTGHVVSSNGGGDYAAQMLLGRMRKAGLVRTTHDPGSSRWTLTTEGARRARSLGKEAAVSVDHVQIEVMLP